MYDKLQKHKISNKSTNIYHKQKIRSTNMHAIKNIKYHKIKLSMQSVVKLELKFWGSQNKF